MQQDAGLRLISASEEGWRVGDGLFHLSNERLSGRTMGLPARRLRASPGEQSDHPGRQPHPRVTVAWPPHLVVPKNNLNRAGNRIPRYRQYIPIPLYSITTQVRATLDFTRYY